MATRKGATSKVFFVLSLSLIINPSLHCMNSTEDIKIAKYISIGLAGLGAIMLSSILIFKAIFGTTNKKKKQNFSSQYEPLLITPQDESILTTTQKLIKQYKLTQETDKAIDLYDIFENFNDEELEDFYNDIVKVRSPYNFIIKALLDCKKQNLLLMSQNALVLTSELLSKEYSSIKRIGEKLDFCGIFKNSSKEKLKKFFDKIVEGLLPENSAILLKDERCLKYNSSCNYETSQKIYNEMKERNLDGIVVLIMPPGHQGNRKMLVVPCGECYSAFHIYDNEKSLCVKKIASKITKFSKNLLGHVILVANASEDNLEAVLKNSHTRLYWQNYATKKEVSNFDSNVIVHNSFEKVIGTNFRALKAYQKEVIGKLFPKSDDDNKAVLMISLQHIMPPYKQNKQKSEIQQLEY